jgi:threonyl-tRNA synthetase
VIGMREAEEGKVAIRTLGSDGQRIMPLAEALAMLKAEATPPDLRG